MNNETRTYVSCARLRDECVAAGLMDIVRGCYALHVGGYRWRVFRPEEIVYRLMRDDVLYARVCDARLQRAA